MIHSFFFYLGCVWVCLAWVNKRTCPSVPHDHLHSSAANIGCVFGICVLESKKKRGCVCLSVCVCMCVFTGCTVMREESAWITLWVWVCLVLSGCSSVHACVWVWVCVCVCVCLCVVGGSGCISPAGWDDGEQRWWKVWVREALLVCSPHQVCLNYVLYKLRPLHLLGRKAFVK